MEVTRGYAFIYARLDADSALTAEVGAHNIHRGAVPEEVTGKAVVMQWMGGTDLLVNGPKRVLVNGLYLVKAVGPGTSSVSLETAANRIDALLDGLANVATTGALVVSCHREAPFEMGDYTDPDNPSVQLGGMYRIQIQAAP